MPNLKGASIEMEPDIGQPLLIGKAALQTQARGRDRGGQGSNYPAIH
jgi:hypothetical protein